MRPEPTSDHAPGLLSAAPIGPGLSWILRGLSGDMSHVARIHFTWDSSCSLEAGGIGTTNTDASTRRCHATGAVAEYAKELRRLGLEASADQAKDLVSLNVGVARVLDLSDVRERERFGVNLDTLTGDEEDDLESCRLVADLARLAGYDAILSPSAALTGERNLNLYIDGRADHLRLLEGRERVPLNY